MEKKDLTLHSSLVICERLAARFVSKELLSFIEKSDSTFHTHISHSLFICEREVMGVIGKERLNFYREERF